MCEELAVTMEEDEAFEALARRNDALEDEKHEHLSLIDQQMRAMIRQRRQINMMRNMLGQCSRFLRHEGVDGLARECERIIEQTKSEGE